MAARLRSACSVCTATSPSTAVSPGLSPSWPATTTRQPTRIAWLYGGPVGAVAKQRCESVTDRRTGGIDLGNRLVGLDLEREIEATRGGELDEKVVEQGHPGRDIRQAGSRGEPGAAHSSPRSISAPSPRSRPSMR